ncbi:WSC-domain-containing protein [Coniochaeta hoffmannii]|uniref:WSC-domain-containing protein n=1 Tax=Coniochaeta hoffmannii TaxID=91930 RepID=A0AA38RWD0_9PEZI|nr:WSC-domain-containing protein [Coniochaeta hoffmannii]
MKRILGALATALWPAVVLSYASTDSIQDADLAQSGYLPNHNMDPNVVGGASFGILWQTTGAQNEVWYAKPLTYTPNGGSEMVITASNMNNVRVHDSKNGTLIAQRQLYSPFLQSDIGCGDIPNYIGVTGTPIIDPATDIVYMMAKGYKNGAASGGMPNGIYKLHALQLPSLTDAPGFPVLIDGHNADNDPTRYFVGGTVLQRPSLTSLNGVVVAAFGGHCDLFNYTGMLVSVSKTPGVGVVSMFAMEASPGAPTPQPLDLTVQNGGKAGIWQSGMGLATDGSRIFAVTGNGQGHANGNIPASGRLPLTTLDEVVGNFAVSSAGKITLTDYFEPYDYVNMDAGDQDLGSSGLALLDASTFKTASVSRIAVTVGKNSKVYVLNAENLGGFKQGAGGTDNIIQTITASNSVFGGAGSYPLEGGYFYFTPVGDYTYAYKFGTDSGGKPFFSLAGKTPTTSAGRAGVGQPTVTTNGGRAGSGILWITDVNTGLRAFKAVPDSNGVLQSITLPATPGINKYQRPAFGDGRAFVTANNKIICLGAPVNLPITCSGPIDFGNVQTGDTSRQMVSCKANVLVTKVNGCTTGDKLFQCDNSTLPQGQVAAGTTFTFPVIWNLTQKAINDAQGVSYGRVIPGVEGAVLNIFTTNGVAGYSTTIPVSLSGTVVSSNPFLFMSPTEVDFGGLVLGSEDAAQGLTGSAVIQNIGNGTLTITGVAWQDGNTPGSAYHNVTYSGQSATFDQGFSAPDFVVPGQTIAAGDSIGMPLVFNTNTTGSFAVSVTVWSDGGVDTVILSASAGNPPIASIAVSTSEGGWDNSVPTVMHFGNVVAGSTVTRQIRICNVGGSVLTITKSKPPISAQLTATNPYGELLEGQKIDVGACAYGSVAVYAAPVQPNHPSQYIDLVWVLNTDGLDALNPTQDFGVHDVETDATIVTRQIGPVLANGTAKYQWVGCFKDTSSLGRNLQNQVNTAAQQANNTNEQCQTLCQAAGYSLAATQYQKECWCGNTIKHPTTYTADSLNLCTFACPGDGTESCGGDNGYMSLYADTTKFDIQAFYASLNALTSTSTSSTPTSTSTSGGSTSTGGSVTTTGTSASISGAASGTTSSTISSSSSGPTTSSSASPLNPNEPDTVNGQWKYIGCYQDNVNGVRSLSAASTAADTMTLESCAAFCSKYNVFGTEYGRECYCGYALGGSNTTSLSATESDCNSPCAASSAQLCGSGNRLSVYRNLVYQQPPPSPSHVAKAGIYGWVGCYTEATNGRALSSFSYADDSMTVDTCAAFCAAKGTALMGVEYGRECYCGQTLAAGSVLTATSDCGTLCKNNTLQYCGAGSRLDLFSQLPPSSSTSTSSASSSTSGIVSSSLSSVSSATSASGTLASFVNASSTASDASRTTSSTVFSTSMLDPTFTSLSTSGTLRNADIRFFQFSFHFGLVHFERKLDIDSCPYDIQLNFRIQHQLGSSHIKHLIILIKLELNECFGQLGHVNVHLIERSFYKHIHIQLLHEFDIHTPGSSNRIRNHHNLVLLLEHPHQPLAVNNSMTPELCIAAANSIAAKQPKPTQYPYVFLEYHNECYGGTSFNFRSSAVTSLYGAGACTDACSGSVRTYTTNGVAKTTTDLTNKCGGAKQFNLYVLSTPVAWPSSALPVQTASVKG